MWIKLLLLVLLTNTALAGRVVWGKKVFLGKGYARSYVESDKVGNVQELGIAMSPGALEGLGTEMKEYLIELPAGVSVPPYDHMSMDWNPHGHEPDNVYTVPHFDFHFYFISRAAQEAISCLPQDAACMKAIDPAFLANAFVPTPAGVPMMGWHWVDSLAPEFNGGKFTRTWIYGYYNGKPIFLEPMITLSDLQSAMTSVEPVRLPQSFPQAGLYPSAYKVTFDANWNLHKVALIKFQSYN